MTTFTRSLILQLPPGQSAFIWGARGTGKSTFLRMHYPNSIYYDLLKTDEYTRLLAAPHLLREELSALSAEQLQQPVIIDEIQKVPALLDEVHWLIENKKIGFILCGSSARKLKRGAANLLGGRAWPFHLFPLIFNEIPDFNLLRALNHGLIPNHYLSQNPKPFLRAYVQTYLREEIQAEGLVRNLPQFARFLDILGFCLGEMLNYSNISRECAVDSKTVKEYFQILEDTLIGYLITPFSKKVSRAIVVSAPKFYLFDVGLANYLSRKSITELRGPDAGKALENYILMELIAYLRYHEIDDPIHYWRTKTGLEVDFILLRGLIAIEVKITANPDKLDLRGLSAFVNEHQPKRAFLVCTAPRKRQITIAEGDTPIQIIPWNEFLRSLWAGQYHDARTDQP